MKKINKIWFVLVPVFVLMIVAVIFFAPFGNKAKGEDNVTMESFNALVEKVEALESQLKTSNDKVVDLTSKLDDANKSITDLSSKTTANTNDIAKAKTDLTSKINSNTSKITKIEAWHSELDKLQDYRNPFGSGYSLDYIWGKMRQFRKTQ